MQVPRQLMKTSCFAWIQGGEQKLKVIRINVKNPYTY